MALKKEQSGNEDKGLCRLVINEELTIYVIDSLKQGLSEEIANCDRLELHLGDVEEIDSAGIQLLLALRAELIQKKKELKLTAVSAVVGKLMEGYGITGRFNIGDAA